VSPTARALADLREMGFVADVVERWIPRARVRKDFAGCIDIIAFDDWRTIGIQATSGANHAQRVAKAKAEPRLRKWLTAPHRRFEAWSYSKRGERGKRKLWTLRREEVLLKDLPLVAQYSEPLAATPREVA
jgi:hypothetical protein